MSEYSGFDDPTRALAKPWSEGEILRRVRTLFAGDVEVTNEGCPPPYSLKRPADEVRLCPYAICFPFPSGSHLITAILTCSGYFQGLLLRPSSPGLGAAAFRGRLEKEREGTSGRRAERQEAAWPQVEAGRRSEGGRSHANSAADDSATRGSFKAAPSIFTRADSSVGPSTFSPAGRAAGPST